MKSSEINFVDLARAEVVAKSNLSGETGTEGHNINKSLLGLSKVVCELAKNKSSYINFRDSKLTRIL